MSAKFHLVLLIHAHQPSGNFEHVLERCYQQSYRPFLECLERHPGVHAGLHFSGPLLEFIEKQHKEYFERLRALVKSGQVEIVGGGFYEPILVAIPPADQQEQIRRMGKYLEEQFGKRPAGAWLAERVWEPQLASALAEAGVAYTLVDDVHFHAAGFEPGELFGDYVAEDQGRTVRILPGLKNLRYLIPFHGVEETIAFLRESAEAHPGGMAAMGDDCEKFGVWPETHKHCYTDGWLERFFTALEASADWLVCAAPGEYLEKNAALGRADLPAASYTEMMEWALPTAARERLHAAQTEFRERPGVLGLLRGGIWRGFFRKYTESNLLHKKMLRVAARLAAVPERRTGTRGAAQDLARARTHVLRAQCNDAYWHGIFGGIYAPHLRTALWRELILAETIVDKHTPGGSLPQAEQADFDADGAEEVVFSAPEYHGVLKPSDGGTLAAMDFRPAAVTLVNSMMRRREEYHARLREAARSGSYTISGASGGEVVSIHDRVQVKEEGLDRYLLYDRWARHGFRVLIFDPQRGIEDYAALRLEENASFAGGSYRLRKMDKNTVEIFREDVLPLAAQEGGEAPLLTLAKWFSFTASPRGCEVSCEIRLKLKEPPARPFAVGIESVINLLAPGEIDRFIESPEGRQLLRWKGSLRGPILRMEDGWQKVRVALHAPAVKEFWVAPIETVSESEEGFERVYQGSQILAVWEPKFSWQKAWAAQLVWRIEGF